MVVSALLTVLSGIPVGALFPRTGARTSRGERNTSRYQPPSGWRSSPRISISCRARVSMRAGYAKSVVGSSEQRVELVEALGPLAAHVRLVLLVDEVLVEQRELRVSRADVAEFHVDPRGARVGTGARSIVGVRLHDASIR